jgi:hypothetical protein
MHVNAEYVCTCLSLPAQKRARVSRPKDVLQIHGPLWREDDVSAHARKLATKSKRFALTRTHVRSRFCSSSGMKLAGTLKPAGSPLPYASLISRL